MNNDELLKEQSDITRLLITKMLKGVNGNIVLFIKLFLDIYRLVNSNL